MSAVAIVRREAIRDVFFGFGEARLVPVELVSEDQNDAPFWDSVLIWRTVRQSAIFYAFSPIRTAQWRVEMGKRSALGIKTGAASKSESTIKETVAESRSQRPVY